MSPIVSALSRWLRNPVMLLVLAAASLSFAVQSGDVGSADTQHRLQSAHAFWTGQPEVLPGEYPEFGVRGRNGKIQSWYGIGQSLLLLPADILGTGLEKLPLFADYNGNDPSVRMIFVSYSVSILLNVLTAFLCFRFLRQLRFSGSQSIAGTLALLALTTHLHYTQNLMENNYIFLLTLAGLSWQFEWVQTHSRRALVLGAAALGLNLLTRLTTGLDLLGVVAFIVLALVLQGELGRRLWLRTRTYLFVAVPVYVFFLFLDRLYQFYRFGSFTNTYVSLVAAEARQRDPSLPLNYPFTTPFHEGFMGALFAREKSIFLFDPLLLLTLLLLPFVWKKTTPAVRAYLLATAALLFAYISFYARYFSWAGEFAWGDRYVSTTVQFLVLLTVPLLLQFRSALRPALRWAGAAFLAAAALVQAASIAFWLPLEYYQRTDFGRPTWVLALRFENILAFALGKRDSWGLTTISMTQDPWDFQHLTAWNLLPFQLQHAGQAPAWVVAISFALWGASLGLLAWALWRLRQLLAASPA